MGRLKEQLGRIAAWISQGANCILLWGHHDLTVSARLYLNRDRKGWRRAYNFVNKIYFWQDDHCRISWLADIHWANELLEQKHKDLLKVQLEMMK